MDPSPPARRPGGRSARVRRAVLDALLELVAESGDTGFSVADVAERAGVHETTIYRRWGSVSGLFMDAATESAAAYLEIPDTGSLREDLLVLVRAVAERRGTPLGQNLLRMSLLPDDPRAEEHRLRYWANQAERVAVIVDRAVVRGEITADAPGRLAIEAVIAPLYMRALATGGTDDPGLPERLVNLVLDGLLTRP